MHERMIALTFTVEAQVAADDCLEFEALWDMTLVGASLCAEAFTGTPSAFSIDVNDDGTAVIAALAASTAKTPGTWKTPMAGGSNTPVHIAKSSDVTIDVNFTGGSSPTADFTLVIFALIGA